MPGIFISYRREDSSGQAGRLADRLKEHFPPDQVFMDIGGIEPGEDFVRVIQAEIAGSDVLLAVIGDHWLQAADSHGQLRLRQPQDFVRLEISTALERGARVIPVLVQSATMPSEDDLPSNLAPLARREAVELRDAHWDEDVASLLQALDQIRAAQSRGQASSQPAGPGSPSPRHSTGGGAGELAGQPATRWVGLAGVGVVLVGVVVAFILLHRAPGPPPTPTKSAFAIPGTLVSTPWAPTATLQPFGLTVAGDRVYVADTGNNTIQVYTTSGTPLPAVVPRGLNPPFNRPTGITIGRQGNLYVADSKNDRIVELSPQGNVVATSSSRDSCDPSSTATPTGVHSVAVTADGTMFAADYDINRVVRVGADGRSTCWSGPRAAPTPFDRDFAHPLDVALDRSNNVYVADWDHHSVVKLTLNGVFRRGFSTPELTSGGTVTPGKPHGIAVDGQGRIYVANYDPPVVYVLSPQGQRLGTIGKNLGGQSSRQFLSVAVDNAGNVYVAGQDPGQILKFAPDRTSTHG